MRNAAHMVTVHAVETRTVTGLDLKLRRIAERVTQRELAVQMNVRPQRISQIEALAVVKAPLATRYVAALAAVAEDPQEAA